MTQKYIQIRKLFINSNIYLPVKPSSPYGETGVADPEPKFIPELRFILVEDGGDLVIFGGGGGGGIL